MSDAPSAVSSDLQVRSKASHKAVPWTLRVPLISKLLFSLQYNDHAPLDAQPVLSTEGWSSPLLSHRGPHQPLLFLCRIPKAFAWWSDLMVEHAETFLSLFAVDMDAALEVQPPDTWDSFPLFQLLNDFLRTDCMYHPTLLAFPE